MGKVLRNQNGEGAKKSEWRGSGEVCLEEKSVHEVCFKYFNEKNLIFLGASQNRFRILGISEKGNRF